MREFISAERRLALTLRYLATGETYRGLMFSCRIHESTISLIIPQVLEAIYKNLKQDYMKMPTNANDWSKIAQSFEKQLQVPYCIGAMDGKHINFRAPRSAGSYYYNYKGTHSIVLLALADADYKSIYIVGVNGRNSDGGVYRESSLKKAIDKKQLSFPPDQCLPGQTTTVPHVFVTIEAFPMCERIIKPYPSQGLTVEKRIFNYRLSRARRIVENVFGILANRFRILMTTINLGPGKVENIVLACCALHNFLATNNSKYLQKLDGEDISLHNILKNQGGNSVPKTSINTRDKYCEYFNTVGAVPWQNKSIGLK